MSEDKWRLRTFTENLDEIMHERSGVELKEPLHYQIHDEAWLAIQRTLDQIVYRLRQDGR